jgi:hypothetical protein
LAHKRYHAGTNGILYRGENGKIKLKLAEDVSPVYEFPVKKGQDTKGCITIWEAPYRPEGETPPSGMYILAHDPYAHDETTGNSLGACYVLKRTNNLSMTLNDSIVASYIGRPGTQDEFNDQMFMLAEYYNAKIGFENDRGDVIGYAKRFRLLHRLQEEFQMLDKRELQSRNVRRAFGMHMTPNRKLQGEVYIRDWLITPIQNFDDGTVKLQLHTILDPGLLRELIKFNHKGNFDRVMALMVGMYHLKELYNSEVIHLDEVPHADFFDRAFFR